MEWLSVDRSGLAAILERRGKAFVLFELVQNAWDSGASRVEVRLTPIAGAPFARIEVVDDSPEGWADLDDAHRLFGRSSRGSDPAKRGRFCLGEKLVLACCRSARIETTAGTLVFDENGRRRSAAMRERGTLFSAEVRMTREELAEVEAAALRLIPPIPTTFNGAELQVPELLLRFTTKLPTELADDTGVLRRSVRTTMVEVYPAEVGEGGILELGVPVCGAEWPWRLNVMQKVPLGMERDSVTDAFRRALQVAAVNAMAGSGVIDSDIATTPWVSETLEDGRISAEATKEIVVKRFGERAVVAVPGDPIANAQAEATGCTVIHGGSLSAGAWANVRKHAGLATTSQAFPTPKPTAQGGSLERCPLCKQAIRT